MRGKFLAIIFLAICAPLVAQQALDNDGVIKMVKAGLSEGLIVSAINASPGKYDTSPEALIALKDAGATDKVMLAIVLRIYGPAAPAARPQPVDPSAAASPDLQPAPAQTAAQATAAQQPEAGTVPGAAPVPAGARVVIAPMGGFETYFAAAVREKKVPITLTLDRASAQYFVVSTNTEWQGFVFGSSGNASWSRAGGSAGYGSAASSTRGLEASIMIIEARTKDVVWAYEVHKSSRGSLLFGTLGARGQQSIAEACAKHLREYIEKGK